MGSDQNRAGIFELTESFDVPTFAVDSNGRITYKNKAARSARIPFRVGAYLKNYISSADMKRLTGSGIYEPVPLSLNSGRIYNCIMQKTGEGYIIKLLSLSALSLYRLGRFAEYAESKLKSNVLLINAILKNSEKAEITNEIAKKLTCMVKLQAGMSDYIRYCGGIGANELTAVSAGESVKPVISAIDAFLPRHTVIATPDDDTGGVCDEYIIINKQDFASMITYLVSFAVRYLRESAVILKIGKYENSVVFSVEGETVLSADAVKLICDFRPENRFPSSHHDLLFSLSVCKALAAHYGWRFDVIPSGIGLSRLKALFSVPLCDDRPPLELHSPDDLSAIIKIIETEFSDLDL